MKKFSVLTFAILTMVIHPFNSNGQCKLKLVGDSLYSTSDAELGGGNSLAYFSILKTDSLFLLKLTYGRGFAKKMEITPSTPLIFVFKNGSEVKLSPLSKSKTSRSFDILYKYAYIGANEISSIYPITVAQLEQIGKEVPEKINLYYYVKNKETGQFDIQECWQLLHYDWHYKRVVKIVNCALENRK